MKLNPLYRAFIDAGVGAGYPSTEDYNGYQQEGFGQMHMTVDGAVVHQPVTPTLSPCATGRI